MLFNSFEFIFIFLPISIIFFFYKKNSNQNLKKIIIIFSLIFYSYYNIYFLPLILASILVNYAFLEYFDKNIFNLGKQVFFNIILLIIFKYSDFLIILSNNIFNTQFKLLYLPFPLALSFFTFQQIAFAVDRYRHQKKVKLVDYMLFITFFPQLIAGPIVFYHQVRNQFKNFHKKFNFENFYFGLAFFFIGLFKKTVLADTFGIYANNGFENYENLDFFQSWISSLSWTLQFYFDFSGYVDMAIGCALFFNIRLPFNFDSPYKSLSIIDFWKKWHITLGNFIQNYMYFPMLKSFKELNFLKSMFCLIFIMTIIGFWHGAGINFIIFGFVHGVALFINYCWKLFNYRIHKFISWFLTFNFVNFSFIIFRSENLDQSISIIKNMIGLNTFYVPINFKENIEKIINIKFVDKKIFSDFDLISSFILIIFGLIIVLFFNNSNEIFKRKINPIFLSVIAFISLLFINSEDFLYFRF